MFKFLGRLATTHPRKVCAAWLVAGLLLTLLAPDWNSRAQDDDIRFLPASSPSVRGYHLLSKGFPQDIFASRAVFAIERPRAKLTEADFALVDQFVADLNALREERPELQIGRVYSHRDPFVGKRLTSDDGECTLVQMSLGTPYLALQTQEAVDRAEARLRQRLVEAGSDAPRLLVTGPAGVGRDLVRASGQSLNATAIATVVLVIVILMLIYRAPLLALVPLLTIGLSSWVALKLLAMLTLIPGFYLVNVSKVFAVVLLYGAGTDYCLFLISRYREELTHGQKLTSAIGRSVIGVGAALAASAGTVICGLGLMGCAEFAKVRCAGPAIALSLAVVLAASLTLTPALLKLLGKRVFWPGKPTAPAEGRWRVGFWNFVSRWVVARPAATLAVAAGLLVPLAAVGLGVRPNYKPTGELGPAAGSIQGLKAIQKHFTAGETGPVTVLLASHTDWASQDGRRMLSHLSRGFGRLENVAEVRSLTQPLGQPLPPEPLKLPQPAGRPAFSGLMESIKAGIYAKAFQAAREHYVAQVEGDDGRPLYVTRLDVVLKSDPFEAPSAATLGVIEAWLREELPRTPFPVGVTQAECYGVTVSARDLAKVTEGDRTRINWLMLGAIFLILLVLVRRPWLAAYLLATVLFSYLATLGATALMSKLFLGRPLGELDWRVPFFLFTILMAVGEDYNILLMSRMLQERKRHGSDEGTRRALAGTGGTITSCGLIMAGTFATLMLAGLGTLVQIGFALAFGVLVDTFVVRPVLVPALTLLVWRWKGRREAEAALVEPVLRLVPRLPLRRKDAA